MDSHVDGTRAVKIATNEAIKADVCQGGGAILGGGSTGEPDVLLLVGVDVLAVETDDDADSAKGPVESVVVALLVLSSMDEAADGMVFYRPFAVASWTLNPGNARRTCSTACGDVVQ